MKTRTKNELVKTTFGDFSELDVTEVGGAYDYDHAYDDKDIYARVGDFDFFFINAVPDDYNIYERDVWRYGPGGQEGHTTVTETAYDLTTDEWIREEIEPSDILDLLLEHKEIDFFNDDGENGTKRSHNA
jgi:hypothetical protein